MSTYREDAERRIVREQAAYWLCELADGTPERHEAFVAWLKRSPHHVGEFLNASTAWKEFGRERPFSSAQIEKIVVEARAQKELSNVVAFESAAPRTHERPESPVVIREYRRLVPIAASLGVVALSAGIVAAWLLSSDAQTYSTAVGEQRAFRLEDGSLLHLNTHSSIKVRYSEQAREVRLLEGEALFTVHRNLGRPFRVEANNVVIQAIGTQFNVHRRVRDITVSVIEGRVSLNGREELGARQTHHWHFCRRRPRLADLVSEKVGRPRDRIRSRWICDSQEE